MIKSYLDIIIKNFGAVDSVSPLKFNTKNRIPRYCYKVICNDKNLRVDLFQTYCQWWDIHKFVYENDLNVAKELFREYVEKEKMFIRICDFIEGSFLDNSDDIKDTYIKSGEQIAKLNLVKPIIPFIHKNDDAEDYGITNSDFSSPNAIYTKDKKIYMIDTNTFQVKKISDGSLDFTLVKPLIKWIKNRAKINYFLEGYSKFRDASKIIKLCENYNWEWKKNKG